MLYYYLLVVPIFLIFIHILFNYNTKARAILKLPTFDSNFIVGHALHMLKLSEVELFRFGRALAARFHGIYGFHAFPVSSVNIYNAEDVEIITSSMKYHEKGFTYNFLKPWLQGGLLLSNGQKWLGRRKILTSAFHFNILPKYFATMKDNNKALIETLMKSKEMPVDIVTTISDYTLNTICETAMGVKLREEKSDLGKPYKEAIYGLGKLFVKRISNVFAYSDFVYALTRQSRTQDKYLNIIHNFTKSVIEKRREVLSTNEATDANDVDDEMISKKKRAVMLDLLLSVQKDGYIDNKGIQEEVDTFMFEGHDTTAGGLTFTLLLLANHPDVQEKVVEELYGIFGEDTRDATLDDIASMKHLELCIKEALRLYPPVPLIMRKISQPCKLSNYDIPANTLCLIHIFDLHRNEKVYPEPNKFDPERFLPKNSVGRHKYAYIPFSAGPRNCIGQKFAMIEMKSAVSSILRHFKLVPVTTVDELVLTADMVLRTTDPIYVKFQPRR